MSVSGARGRNVLAHRLGSPEGPLLGPGGFVFNVCSFDPEQPGWPTRGGDIVATSLCAPLKSVVLFNTSTPEVTGIPAALAFGPDGCLYATDEGRRAIVRVTADGSQSDFLATDGVKLLNGPNDLSFDVDGSLFFTDPWGSTLERPIGAVFGYDWAGERLHRLRDGMAFPNGIVAYDGELYVAETLTERIWVHEIIGPGRVGSPRKLCTLPPVETAGWKGPDGMACDQQGHLFVADLGSGDVLVYDRAGILLERIPTGGTRATNVCFAGPDLRTLVVTVDDLGELITITVDVPGAPLNFCPSQADSHPFVSMVPSW
jgi:gluconolactonase